jgi:hypothetical protein
MIPIFSPEAAASGVVSASAVAAAVAGVVLSAGLLEEHPTRLTASIIAVSDVNNFLIVLSFLSYLIEQKSFFNKNTIIVRIF